MPETKQILTKETIKKYVDELDNTDFVDDPGQVINQLIKYVDWLLSASPEAVFIDIDKALVWADMNDWVFNQGEWIKDGWKTRSTKEVFNLFLKSKQ